ncbi:DUF185-domain-containing protein [Schizopora paradoxa]|uniref:Protein arginine methyltransferase NDUFAF7 n=1 Tax=Schizopora paradoxa TaxID=27342 RepID=A0A0H2RD82_9AGAM|nr:DUF185-domain-containing protein [Schizopora paradoxa]
MLVRPLRSVLQKHVGISRIGWNVNTTRIVRNLHSKAEGGLSNAIPRTSQLNKLIRDTIKATGPITFSSYMQLCLSHPEHGYYMDPHNAIFGKEGDFVTSPEISQIFGELAAIWHLSRWIAAGSPSEIRVIELGPGRGTLMSDALRTWFQFPACRSAIKSIHLVETSTHLKKVQLEKISALWDGDIKSRDLLHWHDSLDDVPTPTPDTFTMAIAHEFFDALPVHIIEKCDDGWHDVLVSFNRSAGSSVNEPPLVLVRSPEASLSAKLLASSSPRFSSRPIGSRLEVSPTSFKIARRVAELINSSESTGGSGLIIDYGGNQSFGSSIRVRTFEVLRSLSQQLFSKAFRDHKIVDIFDSPGLSDMTANVDFAYLAEAMNDAATTHGPISQKDFLLDMGYHVRLSKLLSTATDENRNLRIRQAGRRLIDPTGMGKQYQVLGVTGKGRLESKGVGEEEVWPFVVRK